MKKTTLYSYLLAIPVALTLYELPSAKTENTMLGVNRVPCPPMSDTLVSVPFMKHPVKASKTLASKPTPLSRTSRSHTC